MPGKKIAQTSKNEFDIPYRMLFVNVPAPSANVSIRKFCSPSFSSTGSGLTENEIVWAEELSERSCADGIHGARLQIHEDGAGHVATASGLVVVNIDALQLEVTVTVISTGGIDAVLVGPKTKSKLWSKKNLNFEAKM